MTDRPYPLIAQMLIDNHKEGTGLKKVEAHLAKLSCADLVNTTEDVLVQLHDLRCINFYPVAPDMDYIYPLLDALCCIQNEVGIRVLRRRFHTLLVKQDRETELLEQMDVPTLCSEGYWTQAEAENFTREFGDLTPDLDPDVPAGEKPAVDDNNYQEGDCEDVPF